MQTPHATLGNNDTRDPDMNAFADAVNTRRGGRSA